MSTALATIERKYEILGKIKEGGMGAIYKVRHRLLGETRVIKVMRPQLSSDTELQARFAREARTAIRLRHPNIAQLYDFSMDEEGTAYIVMEYIDGVDLRELQRRLGPPPLGLTLEIAVQSLRALGFLHRRSMVHRDISPDNLMLSRDEDGNPIVKLIDLGIVKVLETSDQGLTNTGMFLGKVRYASPEQFKNAEGGAPLDQRSDLYSFGIVLYEMLTGKYPIVGATNSALIAGHLYVPPVGFDASDPGEQVPAEVRAIVMRLLEKDAQRRYPSTDALIEELRGLQPSHPCTAADLDACFELDDAATRFGAPGLDSAQAKLDEQFARATPPPATDLPVPARTATAPARGEESRTLHVAAPAIDEAGQALAEAVAAIEHHLERDELGPARVLLQQAIERHGERTELRQLGERAQRLDELRGQDQDPAARADALIAEADVLAEAGRRDEAIRRLEQAAALLPDEPRVSDALARGRRAAERDAEIASPPPFSTAPAVPVVPAPPATPEVVPGPAAVGPAVGPPVAAAAPRRQLVVLALLAAALVLVLVAGAAFLLKDRLLPGKAAAAGGGAAGAATETGLLVVHAVPWAEVTDVSGDGGPIPIAAGTVTPFSLALPPGDYKVGLRDPGSDRTTTVTARVLKGQVSRLTAEVAKVDTDSFLKTMGW